jgi:EAL domain-containing protein (putative c-di-GMP-specific phosphodiesterase class I)
VRSGTDVAHLLEQRIFAALNEPFSAAGQELRIPFKTGIAMYPADGNKAESLFVNAAAALVNAKESGERFLFYAAQMNARVAERLSLENGLHRAVLKEQFVLHYQPRIDLGTGQVSGFEALIRWRHPKRGLVPPGEFISVLEDTGLIFEAGRWALKRAALDHAGLRAQGLTVPRIAVNVSAIHLRRKDFVEDVKTALSTAGESGGYIDIELTESMLMEDVEGSIGKLKAIQAMGLQIAIDDFGTGYCSMSYLARLPINSLKIDRSFVSQMANGPEQMAMVSTVISLARALNLKVVAEGVETQEQANLLRLLRCDEAQGYLFGRPEPLDQIKQRLTQQH